MKIIILVILSLLIVKHKGQEEAYFQEPPAEPIKVEEECLNVMQTVCVFNGRYVVNPQSVEKNLILHYTFDDEIILDKSGNNNKLQGNPKVGPENGGKGYSGFYDGQTQSKVEHNQLFEVQEFSICFAIYLLEDSNGQWRTIVRKAENNQQMTFTVLLWPKERRLHIRVSTEASSNEGLDSKAVVPLKRWTYVCIVITNQLIKLYMNGILDTDTILKAQVIYNTGPIYIGKDPNHSGVKAFLDDFRVYKGAISFQQILSLSSNSIGVWGQDFATLGCDSCNYNQALNSCSDNYHLCSLRELYLGGYHIARIMGWFKLNTDIWTKSEQENDITCDQQELSDLSIFKMALCCINK